MKTAIIGSGKVAQWLAFVLTQHQIEVAGLYSRNAKTAAALAKKYKILHVKKMEDLHADLIFLAVNDDSIEAVGKALKSHPATIVHTSGTVGLAALQKEENRGVFYPLQTFASSDFTSLEVPVFICTNDNKTARLLQKLTRALHLKSYKVSEDQKSHLHLAAVITNNFINHLVVKGKEYLESHQLKYDMVVPLIRQTLSKLTEQPYNFTQTGPAARGDQRTIRAHQRLLKDRELHNIYNTITKSILKQHFS